MAGELISFNLGADWIGKLWNRLQSTKAKRRKELEEINRIMFGNPLELARYYVEPKSQEMNPADRHEEDLLVSREVIMIKIDQFFRSRVPFHPGSNQMIILSDAGMGKTTLLIMLKLLHLTSFWPQDKNCILKKLGPNTLDEVRQVENQLETILLLDSLDEDPCAYGHVKDRLMEILETTQHFSRVIITCRTQFFPETQNDPLERPGLITIGGFICPTKYLSFFDDIQVEVYLKKRFPNKFVILPQTRLRGEATNVIKKMGSMRCRPMLLAYIEDLMASPSLQANSNEFHIYKALMDTWLLREEAKKRVSATTLFRACELLATELTLQRKVSVSEKELDLLIAEIPELSEIKCADIKGRSLLNRNSSGDYRFSHFTFQEFLVAHRVLKDSVWEPKQAIPSSDFMLQLLIQGKGALAPDRLRLGLLDLSGANLSCLKLQNADLSGTRLVAADLSKADLSGGKLVNADLSHAHLYLTKLANCDLSSANLSNAYLSGTDLSNADLSNANLSSAYLSGTDLSSADLSNANLSETDLSHAILLGTDLSGADLSGSKLPDPNDIFLRTNLWYSVRELKINRAFPNAKLIHKDIVKLGYESETDNWFGPDVPPKWFLKIGADVALHAAQAIINICLRHSSEISNIVIMYKSWKRDIYIGSVNGGEYSEMSQDELRRLLRPRLTKREFHNLANAYDK